MQNNIFAYHLSKITLVKKEISKLTQVIEWDILCVRPIECEFISAIGIIGKIACIDSIADYEQLDIIK
jgi:hypothetical protein